jgi:predicted kinase
VGGDSSRRSFEGWLANLIRLQDQQTCRSPFCAAPIRHIDHSTRHADGGFTSYSNGRGTCERCNYVREMPGWHITVIDADVLDRAHTVLITTPTGHHYLGRAPDPPWAGRNQECEYRAVRRVLVVVGGLPATGKSTIARIVAEQTKTPYLRVDRIEQAIVVWSSMTHPLGPAGYAVAYELAREQLQLGLDIIVECVNPISLTRDSWVRTAVEAGAAILEIEVVCSDESEHRHRVETRMSDVG